MIRTAIVAVFLTLCALILGPPLILYTHLSGSPNALYWAGVKCLVFAMHIVGMRVRIEGLENIPPGVCLFASNHTSNADVAAILGAIPRRVLVLARKSLFDLPIVGTAFRLAKFVPVDRGNRDAALASVKQAIESIKGGSSFLVYPEGTRSPDGRLQRFKKGPFAMVIGAGIPIVPIACCGTHRIMKKNSLLIHPGKVTVRFGPPIDVSGGVPENRHNLALRVHDAIAAALPEDQKPASEAV
jgi:1-acyl-sn-glycerol-3-phosphate acyltransferase